MAVFHAIAAPEIVMDRHESCDVVLREEHLSRRGTKDAKPWPISQISVHHLTRRARLWDVSRRAIPLREQALFRLPEILSAKSTAGIRARQQSF
jgi:hypothetical protein